jgi:hypothetical protein
VQKVHIIEEVHTVYNRLNEYKLCLSIFIYFYGKGCAKWAFAFSPLKATEKGTVYNR